MGKNTIKSKYTFVPEWSCQSGVLMAWPHPGTDWAYMLAQVQACYVDVLRALLKYEANPCLLVPSLEYAESTLPNDLLQAVRLLLADYNDTWIRDYGPLSLRSEAGDFCLADFGFNGWGLKFRSDKDNLVTHQLFGPGSESYKNGTAYRNFLGYILEGGSVEVDENATLLTTTQCLCSLNRNGGLSKVEVQTVLAKALGINHFLWLDYGGLEGDDTDGHIDTLARMAPHGTIVYVGCSDREDAHYEPLRLMKEQLQGFMTYSGEPFNLLELPLPRPVYDEDDGHRLPATYANYLVTNRAVLMPVYGQPETDELACKIIQTAFPDRTVEAVDCRALIRQHGSLHCATMQINGEMKFS